MNRIFLFSFFILSSQSASAADVAKLCAAKKTFLQSAFAARVGVDEVLAGSAGKDVLVIGESHGERSAKFYRFALKFLQAHNSRLNCLMVEQPQATWQSALDQCNGSKNCDRESVPDFSGVQTALDLGIKVFAVDADVSLNGQNYAAEVPMRNRTMVSNLIRLENSKSCDHSVLIIGSMHGHSYKKTKSVLDLVRESGRSLSSIEIASPGLDLFDHLDQRWIWTNQQGSSICQENPGLINENFALLNSPAPAELPMIYGAFSHAGTNQREFLGSWRDYDSTVFLGCSDPEAKSCAGSAPSGYLSFVP